MATDTAPGIQIMDRSHMVCVTCTVVKQTRNAQSEKDSGEKGPINRVNGVICADLMGLMTPKDSQGNRCHVTLIGQISSCCRVFLTHTKYHAGKKFEYVLIYFVKGFDCRVHAFRIDGGDEYTNGDLFCHTTDVTR